jgi:heme A synthase
MAAFSRGHVCVQPLANLFSIATVQFNHRLLAYLLCLVIGFLVAGDARGIGDTRRACILLGWLRCRCCSASTLLYVVPIPLAAARAGALVLFSLASWSCTCPDTPFRRLRKPAITVFPDSGRRVISPQVADG